ncbi:hypothetical protein JCM24511_06876 [Saitozyma sp. JCM 24511]|nr:hypothetical protein JCM24511_06876 [Saitozyma sp. JCM 24511]
MSVPPSADPPTPLSSASSDDSDFSQLLSSLTAHLADRHASLESLPVTPTPSAVQRTISSLPHSLPCTGKGTAQTLDYILHTLLPGCLIAQNGPRYFGFVTGGVTPPAQLAEVLLTGYDENVQVTLPGTTAATAVEQRTLEMVLDLLDIPRDTFHGRTITTGATSSNILGLACARDHLYASSPHLPEGYSYAQDGPPSAPGLPSPPIIILTLHPHFSILKAAALVGLGGGPRVVHALPSSAGDELAFDLPALKARLEEERAVGRGVIVCYGLGEVNTGGFGTGLVDVAKLCKENGAWLHVDAAFGGFAGIVPELKHLVEGMDLADSLTLDGHKWLNVPYDCGLFFTRLPTSLPSLLGPPANNVPSYLAAASAVDQIGESTPGEIVHHTVPSPLYVNIENSRRFRALPLFASLVALGKEGYIGE